MDSQDRRGETRTQPRAARVVPAVTPVLAPARYVRIPLFEALTGYSARAVEGKIATGTWLEGREFKRAPDGHTLIDMKGYERWVENQNPVALGSAMAGSR